MSAMAGECKDANAYLVAVRDFVVSQDLADTVREFDPGAMIVTARTCRETLNAIKTCDRLALAFVEAGPDRILRARLDVTIRERHGRLVLLGDDAEDEWETGGAPGRIWPVLMRPFSSQAVTALLIAGRRA
ncbi:hypothetical protein [Defluviimonas sp. SAOS-178_SWC]|uniref:hypothetical protein n=1 Tax=Defluviimonas sp. SAOS-178_SWC TaxID=3121287 RepID=UPI0032220C44